MGPHAAGLWGAASILLLGATWARMDVSVLSDGAIVNVSLPCLAASQYLGWQPEDGRPAITLPLVILDGDPCDGGVVVDAAVVHGKAVLLTSGTTACSYTRLYSLFDDKGTLALLKREVGALPGYKTNLLDHVPDPRPRSMLMVVVGVGDPLLASMRSTTNLTASVSPDTNAWAPMFASWYYLLFVRVIPSALLLGAGCAAGVFLVRHALIVRQRIVRDRSPNRRCSMPSVSLSRRISAVHVVLLIEAITSTLLALVIAIGGWYSTANVPPRVHYFFAPGLSGFGFACSLLAASMWYKKLFSIVPGHRSSMITRVLRGDYPNVLTGTCIAVVLTDLGFSAVEATLTKPGIQEELMAGAEVILQFTVGCHLLYGVLLFFRETSASIRENRSTPGNKVVPGNGAAGCCTDDKPIRDDQINGVFRRMAFCTLGLALSMILYCTGAIIIALAYDYFLSPQGWTLAWALALNGRALDSVFRVVMFKPSDNKP